MIESDFKWSEKFKRGVVDSGKPVGTRFLKI